MSAAGTSRADDDEALRIGPSAATAHRLRGAALSGLGRDAEALAEFDAAVRLDPNNPAAYKDRGGVRNRTGAYAEGLRDLDESIRLDPNNPKAYQNRAASYNGLGRYEEAVRDAGEAIRLDPTNAGARNNRGLALVALGRYEEAVDDLTESIRLDPRQVAAYLNRGGAYAGLGLHDRAAADYGEVVRRAPRVALAYRGAGQYHDLLRLRAVQDPDAALERGNARRASGDWSGAVAEYTRALQADPRRADAYALRGWSRLCGGEPGAETDARAWLGLNGWRDPFAPYMALLGALDARRSGREHAAAAFLDEAVANTRPGAWPAPVFRYLKRELSLPALLNAADDLKKTTEARAVAGFDLFVRGSRDAALEHLRWVCDHGLDRSVAKDLARETVRSRWGSGPGG